MEKKENNIKNFALLERNITVKVPITNYDNLPLFKDSRELFPTCLYLVGFPETERKGVMTKPLECARYLQKTKMTLVQMLADLQNGYRKPIFTQEEVVQFCKQSPEKLAPNGTNNLFFFCENDLLFVAEINVSGIGNGLTFCWHQLSDPRKWALGAPVVVFVPE